MTTLQPQPSSYLQSMLLEDQMELSPGPGIGDDIDIDLDLDAGPLNDQDNDCIIEDARSENTAEHIGSSIEVGNDDVMHDEDHTFTDVQEQDVELPDEELYDAHDRILIDDHSNQRQQSGEYAPNVSTFGEDDALRSPRLRTSDDLAATIGEHQEINFAEDKTYASENSQDLTTKRESPTTGPQEIEVVPVIEQPPAPNEHNPPEPDQGDQRNEQEVPLDERVAPSVPAARSNDDEEDDDALTDTYEEEGSNEPKDPQSGVAHIHPVVVIYEGSEISLFPPFKDDTSDTFFLPDESLARANMCDLFEAIRSVLAGTISEDDELEMTVEGLGLELSEDSIHARTTTLFQIVDLHVQLFHQDGVDEPDPLYMTLTTKVRFSKRFSDISSAAAEGKGISQLVFWHGEGQDYGGFPTENTSHSEDTDHPSGWGADYPFHQDLQSPAKGSDNPDATGSGHTGDSPALLPTVANQKDSQEPSGAIRPSIPKAPSDAAESTEANNHEDYESTKIETGSLAEEDRSQDESVADTDHQKVVQETTSYPVEDELRDDDLIDYDDDDDDGAGQYTSTGSSTLQSDDRRTSNEAEYAAINAAASRRSSAGKLGHENSKDAHRDDMHSENEQVGDFGQPGVSGYEEDYGQYNDETNHDKCQQYGDEAEHTLSEAYEDPEDPEQYAESTGLNEYVGFHESTKNEYTVNDPEDWDSSAWHPEEQENAGENHEEYYQQENTHGNGGETEQSEEIRYIPEHANLDLHFDGEVEGHPLHDSQIKDRGQANDSRYDTPDVSAPADTSGEQHLGQTEQPTGVEEDEALYDDDDAFSDALYGRDESVGTSDGEEAASLARRDSVKRSLNEIEDGSVPEGDRQGTKRIRSR